MSFVAKVRRRVGFKFVRLLIAFQASALMPTPLRMALLRAMGAKLDRTAGIAQGVFIGAPWRLRMGAHAYVNMNSVLDGCADITLGDGVRVGLGVTILTGTHPIEPRVMRRDVFTPITCRPVVVERGCWIGSHTLIMPGVHIGEGCVVGGGSVVTEDCLPNGLYANMAGGSGVVRARRVRNLPLETEKGRPVSISAHAPAPVGEPARGRSLRR